MDYYAGQDTSLATPYFPGARTYLPPPVSNTRSAKTVGAWTPGRVVTATVSGLERSEMHSNAAATQRRFNRLAARWKQQTQFTSAIDDIAMNAHYQHIIGMGPSVVPFILNRLKAKPDFWFWALEAITHANPVRQSAFGNMQKMTSAWLRWGRRNNYSV